jgi:GDP-L-fucose synthase
MHADARIYVAGGDTLLGRALVDHLARHGFANLVGVPPHEPDLARADHVDDFFRNVRPEYVFVTAGRTGGIEDNRLHPADLMLDNLLVAAHVIPAAARHGARKLVYLASSCCYPRRASQPLRALSLMTGWLEPTSEAYATAKLAGLKLCQAYRQQFDLPFVAAIPANTFGPWDDFEPPTGHVIPALMRRLHEAKLQEAEELTIWGTGQPRRDFIYAADVADACVFLMQHYDEAMPINIGSGREWTIAETAKLLAEVVGYTGRLEFDPGKPDGAPRKVLDSEPLFALGWRPRTEFRAALEETYAWFVGNAGCVKRSADAPNPAEQVRQRCA